MSADTMPIQMFVVDERPFACWGVSHNVNLAFIRSIDPQYFNAQADAFEPLLQSNQNQHGATALRLAYSHALETLFALFYASLQAPNCVQGWLLKYRVEDLHRITEKIRNGKSIYTRFNTQTTNWQSILQNLYSYCEAHESSSFVEWYDYFSGDLIDDARRGEYNQLKHGFRTRSTPTLFMLHSDGDAEPIKWQSEYGMGFSEATRLHQGNGINFKLEYYRVNWTALHMSQSLRVISVLIYNLVAMLQYHLANEIIPLQLLPNDITVEKQLESRTHTLSKLRRRLNFDVQVSNLLSTDEILASYIKQVED